MVVASDAMGHTITDLQVSPGAPVALAAEAGAMPQAVYCLSGNGRVATPSGEYPLSQDVVLAGPRSSFETVQASEPLHLVIVRGGNEPAPRIVRRSLQDILDGPRDVFWGNGRSRRFLVAADGMGFALCSTTALGATTSPIQYKHHYESCYYYRGSGEYRWPGGSHAIETERGEMTMFVMNRHDAHSMCIAEPAVCLSVFTPPIDGHEAHCFDTDGYSVY